MSVTSGFLRLTLDSLKELTNDAGAFETACRNYDDPNYLDMDRAGYELLFILDPASVEFDNPDAATPYPAIRDVLSGGQAVHERIDLGCGPAKVISTETLAEAIPELESLTADQITEIALANEILPEVLMCEIDESMIREYHCGYFDSLRTFIRESLDSNMVLLRY